MNFDKALRLYNPPSKPIKKITSLINTGLHKIGWNASITPAMNHATIMVSPFQKLNFFHLINNILFHKIPGEFVELGCFEGQTAILFQYMLEANKSNKKLLLYDNFKHQIGIGGDIKTRLFENFKTRSFPEPILIEGSFEDTLPSQLPVKISFMHIDCGYGGDRELHKKVVLHCLESCYDRMSPGAIGVLSDYHDNEITVDGYDSNPGVKLACDVFFNNKPEKMFTLYGGEYSHGYFRKSLDGN